MGFISQTTCVWNDQWRRDHPHADLHCETQIDYDSCPVDYDWLAARPLHDRLASLQSHHLFETGDFVVTWIDCRLAYSGGIVPDKNLMVPSWSRCRHQNHWIPRHDLRIQSRHPCDCWWKCHPPPAALAGVERVKLERWMILSRKPNLRLECGTDDRDRANFCFARSFAKCSSHFS